MKKFVFAFLFMALGVVLFTASPGYCVHKKSVEKIELTSCIIDYAQADINMVTPTGFDREVKAVSHVAIEVKNCENLTSKTPVKPDKIPYNWSCNNLAILNSETSLKLSFKPTYSYDYPKPDLNPRQYCSVGARYSIVSYRC